MLISLTLLLASPQDAGTPIAMGSWAIIQTLAMEARRCGATLLRFDPLDDRDAMLLLGRNEPRATACVRAWVKRHGKALNLRPAH